MLNTSERVSPCSARCSPRSVGRLTTISSPSCATVMSRGMRSESSPLGPFTRTRSGSIETVTPDGTGMGSLPMRLIAAPPHLRHDLAADALVAGVVAGHHAGRRGDDRRAHPALDLGDVLGVDVGAPARARHPAHAGDDRLAVLGVAQDHANVLAGAARLGRLHLEALDVALLLEDAGDLLAQARG